MYDEIEPYPSVIFSNVIKSVVMGLLISCSKVVSVLVSQARGPGFESWVGQGKINVKTQMSELATV